MRNLTIKGFKSLRIYPWIVIVCASLFYSYQFLIRVSPGVMQDEMLSMLAIDGTTFGLIVGFYYWGYSGMQIPLGLALDKLGPRYLLTCASLLCAVACLIFGAATNVFTAMLARFLMGVGASCGFIGTLKFGTLWFPSHRFGTVMGITYVFGTMGAAMGGAPLSCYMQRYGWYSTFNLIAMVGVVLACVIFCFTDNNGPYADTDEEEGENNHMLHGMLMVIKSPQAWLLGVIGALMYMPISILGDSWGVPFLKSLYNHEEAKLAPIVAAMFTGGALGAPVFATLSDYVGSRKKPLIIGIILSLIVWSIVIFMKNIPISVMYGLFFMGGFVYTAKSVTFAASVEIMPTEHSGISLGFTNMIVMLTGVIGHPIIGYLLDTHSAKHIRFGVGAQLYLVQDYRFAMSILPCSMILCLILVLFLDESHPRCKEDK